MDENFPHLMLVTLNAVEGAAERVSAWYTDVHIPEVLANLDALAWARRYQVAPAQMPGHQPRHRFLALYGVADGRLEEARDAMVAQREERAEALAAGRTPTIGVIDELADIEVTFFESISPTLRAD